MVIGVGSRRVWSWRMVRIGGIAALAAFLVGCDSPEEKVEYHYERGLELVEKGEHLKASLEFRNALTVNDKHVPALFALAKSEQRLGKLVDAAGIYVRVVEAAPEHLEARVALANILLLAGRLDDALKYANQAFGLAPEDVSVLVVKAALAVKLGNINDAIAFSEKALEKEPENVDALMVRAAERFNSKDLKGALEFLDRGEAANAGNLGLQLFRLQVLAALEDREGIEGVLQKLVAAYPKNEHFRYALVRWYRGIGQSEAAEAELRKFVKDSPENTKAGLALVTYLARTNGFEDAHAELTRRVASGNDTFTYTLALAELTFGNGDHDEAFALLEKTIADQDDASEQNRARILLARMKLNQGETKVAKSIVERVLGSDEKNVNALTLLSSIDISEKSYAQAVERLLAAINEEPESTRLLLLLAQAHELNGSASLAEEQLAKAARLAKFSSEVALPYSQFLLRYGKLEQAERVLQESNSVSPGNRQVLTQLAQLKLSRQDWLGAQEIAETIRKLKSSEGVADRIRALALAGQEKFEESNALLQSAMSDTSSAAAPVKRYVENLIRSGKKEKALAFVTEILADNPENVRVRVLLGILHETDGKHEMAEASYRTAVEHEGDSLVGSQSLARFYLRNDKTDAAEQVIREALGRQPDNASIRLLLAALLERSGRYELAIEEYQILHDALPRSTIIANNLASLLADYGESDESLKRAHAIAVRFRGSDIPQFLDTLGWVHYRRGEYEQAVALIKRASEQLEDIDLVQYHLGMAYKALGERELAIEALGNAISLAGGRRFAQLASAQAALKELGAEN